MFWVAIPQEWPFIVWKYTNYFIAVRSSPNFIVYFLYSEGFWNIVYDLRLTGNKDKKYALLLSPNTPLEH